MKCGIFYVEDSEDRVLIYRENGNDADVRFEAIQDGRMTQVVFSNASMRRMIAVLTDMVEGKE